MSANLIEKGNQDIHLSGKKLKELQEQIKKRIELEKHKKEDFEEKLYERLKQAYLGCKKLSDDSQKPNWSEIIQGFLKDSAELTLKAAAAGGAAYVAGSMIGGKKSGATAGTGAAVGAALLTLWQINNQHTAIERAKGFLAMVEDVKNNGDWVDSRLKKIAISLSVRFEPAIANLSLSDDGIGRLATFLAVAIIRDFPISIKGEGKLRTERDIIDAVSKTAVPPNGEDPIYKGTFGNLKLSKDDNQSSWTIPGLLLRSPIWNTFDDQCYIRSGKDDKSSKYPVQIFNQRPMYYMVAPTDIVNRIKASRRSPILSSLENEFHQLDKLALGSKSKNIPKNSDPKVIQDERQQLLKRMNEVNSNYHKQLASVDSEVNRKVSSELYRQGFFAGMIFRGVPSSTKMNISNRNNNIDNSLNGPESLAFIIDSLKKAEGIKKFKDILMSLNKATVESLFNTPVFYETLTNETREAFHDCFIRIASNERQKELETAKYKAEELAQEQENGKGNPTMQSGIICGKITTVALISTVATGLIWVYRK